MSTSESVDFSYLFSCEKCVGSTSVFNLCERCYDTGMNCAHMRAVTGKRLTTHSISSRDRVAGGDYISFS